MALDRSTFEVGECDGDSPVQDSGPVYIFEAPRWLTAVPKFKMDARIRNSSWCADHPDPHVIEYPPASEIRPLVRTGRDSGTRRVFELRS